MRHKPQGTHVDRAAKFKARLRENTEAAGLPDTPSNRQRIMDATWIDLAMDNTRQAILHGDAISADELTKLVAARNSILPAALELTVRFVGPSDNCPKCGGPLPLSETFL